jgi:uncharacterized protein YndB with AHSA1/START domain
MKVFANILDVTYSSRYLIVTNKNRKRGAIMPSIEDLIIDIEQDIVIAAPLDTAFQSTIHQLTEGFTGMDDQTLSLKLESKPGGRWFRDLGKGRGHLWGVVQSIRKPDLIELSGPLFMSNPVINHIIIRFEDTGGGTRLRFRHRAFGLIDMEHRGIEEGWKEMLERVKAHAAGETSS